MILAADNWFFWAALSACFTALTAIFVKIGIEGVDADFAMLIRTMIIVFVLAAFVWYAGKWLDPRALSPRPLAFLSLSALAAGASWVCYFRALQVGEASKVVPVGINSARFWLRCSPSCFWASARPRASGSASASSPAAFWYWRSSVNASLS